MDQKMVVLEGKDFTIELQSMLGSTGYGWYLSQLPEGIIFEWEEKVPVGPAISPIMQKFHFGVVSAKEPELEITFAMVRLSELSNVVREYKVSLTIIPSNSEEFIDYSENANALYAYAFNQTDGSSAMNCAIPYGYQTQMDRMLAQKPYGFPEMNNNLCSLPDSAALKYGYPCGMQDAVMKYGYPCGMQDAVMKYGYPGGMQDTVMKYGYPCGMQDAVMKYGYPGGMQDTVMKYGYPCGMQDAMMKYGYFCGTNDALPKNEPFIRKNRNEPFITKNGYVCR